MKTCWKTTEDLRTFGTALLASYYTAVELTDWAGEISADRGDDNRRREYTDNDLVYYSKSSDFCLADLMLGSVGTRERLVITDFTSFIIVFSTI